jgi:hypothetical protein
MTGCDICGLESRLGRPLEFLGLYNMEDRRDFANVPAVTVAGDQTEQRILGGSTDGPQVYYDSLEASGTVCDDSVDFLAL